MCTQVFIAHGWCQTCQLLKWHLFASPMLQSALGIIHAMNLNVSLALLQQEFNCVNVQLCGQIENKLIS